MLQLLLAVCPIQLSMSTAELISRPQNPLLLWHFLPTSVTDTRIFALSLKHLALLDQHFPGLYVIVEKVCNWTVQYGVY